MQLWGRLLGSAQFLLILIMLQKLAFAYTTEVCLVLYELLVSKRGQIVTFWLIFFQSLLTMCAYMHAYCCSMLKLDVKLDLIASHREDENCY